MSITGNRQQRRPRRPNANAEHMAQMHGGEPEDYDENPAFKEWTDAKLKQAGFDLKAIYAYTALDQRVLYEVLRYEHRSVKGEKRFLQRMPTGETVTAAAWFATAGYVKVPYRWPQLALKKAVEQVLFTEGEKDTDRLTLLGLLATTVAGQNWSDTCAQAFADCDFVALEDYDEEGRANALAAAQRVYGIARSIKIVRLPGLPRRGDVSDWLDAGHTKEELLEIIARTPEWFPEETIRVKPHRFPDETTIPQWEFLYGNHLLRGMVSVTAAAGETGKSTKSIGEALAMASGKPLLGVLPQKPLRDLLINLEDDRNTIDKRIAAAMKYHGLTPADIGNRLFTIAKGELKIKLATQTRPGMIAPNETAIKQLVDFIIANEIDVVSIDPLRKTHRIPENDIVGMGEVMEIYEDIANEAKCAIHLWHHLRKGNGGETTMESVRGASSIVDASRSCEAMEKMSKEEAKKCNVEEQRRRFFFRSFNGKINFAPPTEISTWYELKSVILNNGGFGDDVGVVTPWQHPGSVDIIPAADDLLKIKAKIREGNWREDVRAGAWVGKAIAQALGRDPEEDAQAIKTLISRLIREGVLRVVQGRSSGRKEVMFVVVNEGPAPAAS